MRAQETQQQAHLFRTLMHPVRLAILDLLRGEEECVCHLEARLGYPQAYISQQLAVLRAAGLVHDRREGWNIFYRVTRPEVFTLLDQARALLGLPAFKTMVSDRSGACPCPKCGPAEERAAG
jgi:DNA-binding transcriptional ArsR family regulator